MGHWLEITPLQYLSIVEGDRPDVELLDLSTTLLRRRRELRQLGEWRYSAAITVYEAEMEPFVLERLRAGQTVYLFQPFERPPIGWHYAPYGSLLRATLDG